MPELRVIFSAVTSEFDKAINKVNRQIEETGRKFQQLSALGDKLSSIGKRLSLSLTAPIAGLATTAGLAVSKFAEFSDRISDLTQITGLSAKAIQEWQHVARKVGVDVEALTNAVAGFIRKLPALEQETGISAEQFAKLGINLNTLKRMSPDEAIDTIMKALARMENTLERNAVASAIFGLAWKDIAPILGLGIEGIEQARQEANKLGLVLSNTFIEKGSQIKAQLEVLKAQLEMTFIKVGEAVAPIVLRLSDSLRRLVPVLEKITQTFASLPQPVQDAVVVSLAFLAVLGPLTAAIGALIKTLVTLKTVFVVLITASKTVSDGLGKLIAVLQGLSFATKMLSGLIGFLVADFILGAVHAERFKQKVEELRNAMKTAASDAERYAAAMQLWETTRSVEALNTALKILEKYNISADKIIEKSEELGISYIEAAVLLIRQAEATKMAADSTKELTAALSSLQKVQSKNLQTFDEVHTITKEGTKDNIFSDLTEDVKEFGKAVKDVNVQALEDAMKQLMPLTLTLGDNFEDLTTELTELNPTIETSFGKFRLVEEQLQLVDWRTQDLTDSFNNFQLELDSVNATAEKLMPSTLVLRDNFVGLTAELTELNSTLEIGFGKFRLVEEQLQLVDWHTQDLTDSFNNFQQKLSGVNETAEAVGETLDSSIKLQLEEVTDTIDFSLIPAVENIGLTFETAADVVTTATSNISATNSELTNNLILEWQYTSNQLVGNSIIPDMVNAIIKWFASLGINLTATSNGVSQSVIDAFQRISDNLKNTSAPDIKESAQKIEAALMKIGLTSQEIEKTVSRAFENMARDVARILWDLLSNQTTIGDAMKRIWQAVGDIFKYIFIQLISQVIAQNLAALAKWVAGIIAQAASAVGALLSQAYAALVAFFAFLGPGAPIAAAAVMAGVGAAIVAFAAWAVGAIKNALGLAEGGIVSRPTFALVGEAGPEAVIPLNGTLAEEVQVGVFNALTLFKNMYSDTEHETVITIELDGTKLAQTLVPYILREFDRLGIEVV